jgi:predicted ATPase/DNA-binding XRE family transcriptional regulator
MTDDASFGSTLKQRRKALDMTREQLAERVGCAVETLRKIETGARRPSRQIAERLAVALAFPPEERAAFVRLARASPAPTARSDDTAAAPYSAAHAPSHRVPLPPTSLIGRARELADVRDQLLRAEVRLLTLTGPPGVGKTRLSLQVAADVCPAFTHGVAFVALASVPDPDLVASTITQALGIKESVGQTLIIALAHYLRERRVLLLLDNFEQVVAAAPLLVDLLASAPQLKILVTSRTNLRVTGEHEYAVPPLALPNLRALPPPELLARVESVELFVQRAQAVASNFTLTDANAQHVAAICARLDGLPLAIELAAARSKLFAPAALLARLDRCLALLTHGARDAPPRQQTLRAAIDWSYDLLSASEQTLLARLGIFIGGCTMDAAEAVCNQNGEPPSAIVDGIAALLDQSLVQQTTEPGGEPRLLMLETIREYALERLAARGSDEVEAVRRRHARHFLTLAEQAERELSGAESARWLNRLDAEYANLWAALEWTLVEPETGRQADKESGIADRLVCLSRQELGLRLAGALQVFWERRGRLSEGRERLAAALARAPEPTIARARALYAAGELAFLHGDRTAAHRLTEEGLVIFRQLKDGQGIAISLISLGRLVGPQDAAAARSLYEESLAIEQGLGNSAGVAQSLYYLGIITWCHGQPARALPPLEECLALYRGLGDKQGIMSALGILGSVAWTQGDYARAMALYQESLALAQELGAKDAIAMAIINLGQIAWFQGDYARATALHTESLALAREAQLATCTAWSLRNLGSDAWAQGDYAQAIPLHRASLPLYWNTGDIWGTVECIEELAWAACSQGQATGDAASFVRAARLLGAAAASRETTGNPMAPAYRVANERAIAETREQMGEASFTAAWAAGHTMTLEHAVEEALESGDEGRSHIALWVK